VAVLSGNRNFEGRIHKLVRANYIGAPPLVVIYALAGRIDIDLEAEPVGFDSGRCRRSTCASCSPRPGELAAAMTFASDPGLFSQSEDSFDPAVEAWRSVAESGGSCFAWNPESHYLVEPPFFTNIAGGDDDPLVRSRFRACPRSRSLRATRSRPTMCRRAARSRQTRLPAATCSTGHHAEGLQYVRGTSRQSSRDGARYLCEHPGS
jgi:hypothetical protein